MENISRLPIRTYFTVFVICSFFYLYPHNSCVFALSTEEERVMGERFLAEVQKQMKFIDDDFVNQYINSLGRYLIRPLDTKPFPFRFYIIKDSKLNAFAAPGGHIFLFSGLIEAVDVVDELAAVICHEIAHVSARHLAQRIEQNKKIGLGTMAGVLAGVLIGGKAGGAVSTGSVAAGIQTQLHFSRNDERQADQLGFKYMDASGFDPSHMVTVLNRIQSNQWYGTGRVPSYLLTHPTGPERMANLDTMRSGYSGKTENDVTRRFRAHFPYVKSIIIARYSSPSDAERFFNSELQKNAGSPWAHFGLGMVMKRRSEDEQARDHFEKAMKGDPGAGLILKSLGESSVLNDVGEEGIASLEKAVRQNPEDRTALFLLGNSYQEQEQYEKAIQIFLRLLAMEPVRNEVFHNLGICYGRLEKLALAHYYLGVYFQRTGKRDKVEFHFRKAESLAGNDPALRDRIRKAAGELAKK